MEPRRLSSLDALRGVAALAVVVWHWQHFFAIGGDFEDGWTREMQPLFWLLKPLYLQGWAAVDLFFALSGFVFFWLYGEAIRTRATGAGPFALLRISRLYPLHVATLVAVAGLQALFWRAHGQYFIYQANDAPHFAAQLLFVQNWWPQAPQSFNGPSWSVSVEVLLYCVFFAACRLGLKAGWRAGALALAGVPLLWVDGHIARGVIGFFMGGAMVGAWRALRRQAQAAAIARWLMLAVAAAWLGLYVALYREWFESGEANKVFALLFDFGLCPLTVLALALREDVRAKAAWLGFLGDISYSTYLIHFPLQLTLALLAARFAWTPETFMQGWVMLAFYAVLIGLGALSYRYFERPMRTLIRNARVFKDAPEGAR
jgi:peptidoglycan/LPS O-acetylase OafA/YrhL